MKLEEAIKERTVVWCKTEDEAVRILTEANRLGCRWSNGRSYMDVLSWDEIDNCYNLKGGMRGDVGYYNELGFTIINSTEIETEVNSLGINLKAWDELVKDAPQSTFGQKSALKEQIGGEHYKHFEIQPFEFIQKNNLSFAVGNVIKYVTRYKAKNGVEDLKKARHYIDLLIELEQ